MKTKLLFSFLLLLSMNAFAAQISQYAGQDGNGSDGGLTEAERRACNIAKYALVNPDDEADFTLTIIHEDEILAYSRADLLQKCCHITKNNCSN